MNVTQDAAGAVAPPTGLARRIVHLHIPKTAGTALRSALTRVSGLRVFPKYGEAEALAAKPADFDVFSGHFGFDTASVIGGDIITVMRHPVDRFASVYYFWRQLYADKVEVTRKTRLASSYDLEGFASLMDEILLIEEFHNRVTWQLACGNLIRHRTEGRDRGLTDDDLLRMAMENVEKMALVGFQDQMDDFTDAFNRRFGFALPLKRVNATRERVAMDDIPHAARRRIQKWLYLDIELYRMVRKRLLRGA